VQRGLLSMVLNDQHPSGISMKSSSISTGPHGTVCPQIAKMSNSDQTAKQDHKARRRAKSAVSSQSARLQARNVEDLKP
jgi:hypothetical protein